ncbi:MAG: DUF1893 domain-containing protein [Thaumarchaeota archaeon]|nr:DUF1893 domain-containing protein [Nitrososphaerota archaeon]MCL5318430.1 DUF1893 domain-containing protein [Nitrososphaerota archaeon]
MHDLETAEATLTADNLSIVFVKDGQIIFSSGKNGLKPLVDAIQIHRKLLEGSSMADKVIGRAAALLAIHAKVKSVYAFTIASGATRLLDQHAIPYRYGSIVERILNRDGTDTCPFEKTVHDTNNPEEALHQIIKTINRLSATSGQGGTRPH